MQEEACRTEIRHLSDSHKSQIAKILDSNENWKKLFGKIPKNLEDIGRDFEQKYEVNRAEDIKKEADRQGLPVAMVLFDEWGTSGQIRPTVEHLYKLLNLIPLYRASDYIAENILKISPAERPLNGPGHRIDISLPTPICNNEIIENMLEGQLNPGTSAIERDTLPDENQDIPRLNDSFKKINVIPETPSTRSPSTKLTTVTETNKENEPSEFDWRPVNSGDIPQCINGPISTARDSVKANNNASGCMNSVNSADPQKSIDDSHSTRDNWSSTTPRCIMDPPVGVGNSM